MIVIVQPHNAAEHGHLLDQMFRHRARVFRDQLGWDVQVVDGRERDKFDEMLGPVYVLCVDDHGGAHRGSLRLLPTTGPTMAAEVFSDTMPDAAGLSAPTIWECSRLCVADHCSSRQRLLTAGRLLVAVGELSMRGGIETIIGNFDDPIMNLYRRLGCEIGILGHTDRFGKRVFLGSFKINAAVMATVAERLERL
jgi:N-acyl-L-homoserine lactone synthetase